jgi:hypothetical protein
MGRYDGPYFAVEDEDVVSIWIAKCSFAEIPENYFEENYGGEDDEDFNAFSADFGFGFYDHDLVETFCRDDRNESDIAALVKPLSYSGSFLDSVISTAKRLKIDKTSFVFLLYNFKYDPKVTKTQESQYMRFLGVFPYDRKSAEMS